MRELIRKIGAHYGALPMSWSRINLLLTCPRQFDLKYRQKIKDEFIPEDPSAAEAGTLMHKTLELAMFRCMTSGNFAFEASGYEFLFSQMLAKAEFPGTRERMLSLRVASARVLAKLLGVASANNAQLSMERRLAMDMDWNPKDPFSWNYLAWMGFVDLTMLARDKCIIVDYKSEPWTEERSNKTESQTMQYAYVTMLTHPQVQSVQTVTAFLQDERFVVSGNYQRSVLPELEERLRRLFTKYLEVLESGDKSPRASSLCQWCSFSQNCPQRLTKEKTWQEEEKSEEKT